MRNYIRRTAKVMFSSLLVGLSVCLLATLRETHERIFMKFSGKVEQDPRDNLKNFGVLCLTPSIEERRYIEVYSSMIQLFYIFFFPRKSVPVSNITGKRMNGFS